MTENPPPSLRQKVAKALFDELALFNDDDIDFVVIDGRFNLLNVAESLEALIAQERRAAAEEAARLAAGYESDLNPEEYIVEQVLSHMFPPPPTA